MGIAVVERGQWDEDGAKDARRSRLGVAPVSYSDPGSRDIPEMTNAVYAEGFDA